jgi:hypothetical protein
MTQRQGQRVRQIHLCTVLSDKVVTGCKPMFACTHFGSWSMSFGALLKCCASCESLFPSYGTVLRLTVDQTVHTAHNGIYCYGSRILAHLTTIAKGLNDMLQAQQPHINIEAKYMSRTG